MLYPSFHWFEDFSSLAANFFKYRDFFFGLRLPSEREHALAWKLSRSGLVGGLLVWPGGPSIKQLPFMVWIVI
jgi:hypothetical protein